MVEGHASPAEALDASLSLIVRVARLLCESRDLNPLRVQMTRDAPAPSGPFERFFRSPIAFRARRNAVDFARADLDAPLPNGDRLLGRSLEPLLAAAVARQHGDPFVSRVREILAERLGDGEPTQASIARALGMSQRTLQRRLADLGLSYQVLLSETRARLARSYLAAGGSVTETAFRLGFASSSSLARAFRRWTGRAPSDPE